METRRKRPELGKFGLKKHLENQISNFLAWCCKPVFVFLFQRTKIGRMAMYKALSPGTLLIAEASNQKYLVNSSDAVVGFSTYINRKAFDHEKVGPLLSILGDARSLMLDIGANIGTIGLAALEQREVSEVWAFEPDPHNYSLLVSNIWLNGLSERVKHFNVALTDKTDVSDLELQLNKGNFGGHRVNRTSEPDKLIKAWLYESDRDKTIIVKSARLDDFCEGLSFEKAVVWMDVEGYEGHVLCGATMLIDQKVPIVTEFSPYALKRAGGFDKFIDVIVSGPYSKIIDVNDIEAKLRCNKATFLALANYYGYEGDSTDLLIC